ncbi:MAG TPA: hypothetical protein VG984_00955 [Candidatus Paceibacterota bacterium]|nr:hypothetical protein [Candidatus Paceibacterota bacterium]
MGDVAVSTKIGEVLSVETSSVFGHPLNKLSLEFNDKELQELGEFLARNPKGLAGTVGVTKVFKVTAEDRQRFRSLPAEVRYMLLLQESDQFLRAALHARVARIPVQVVEHASSRVEPVKPLPEKKPAPRTPQQVQKKGSVVRWDVPQASKPSEPPAIEEDVPESEVVVEKKPPPAPLPPRPPEVLQPMGQRQAFFKPNEELPSVVTFAEVSVADADKEWKVVFFKNPTTYRRDMDKVTPRKFVELWEAGLLEIPEGREDEYAELFKEAKRICSKAAK